MVAKELQTLLVTKWGYSYDLQLRKTGGKVYLQIMWRYLEQASFPLSEEEYLAHLESLLSYLNDWQVIDQISSYIEKTRTRPRLGKAVVIPLEIVGGRQAEWLLS